MTADDSLKDYLAGLSILAPPTPIAQFVYHHAGELAPRAASPAGLYGLAEFEETGSFLLRSQALHHDLRQRWQDAGDEHERSKLEVQLLGAAAADLLIAERLVASLPGLFAQTGEIQRGSTLAAEAPLIHQAIAQPESLLVYTAPNRWRGAERAQLLETTHQSLEAISTQAGKASQDAVTDLLAMNYAIVKQAVDLLGAEIAAKLRAAAVDSAALAIVYVLTASDKIHAVLGTEGERMLKEATVRFLDDLRYGEVLGRTLEKFLRTEVIYEEGKAWIGGYPGDITLLAGTAERMAVLRGSFAGREKVSRTVLKGLAVVKLLPPLQAPPWGPLGVAAAYLAVLAYILYSAYDHVDSDRYPFFDRVKGVRGILKTELNLPEPAPVPSDLSPS